MWYVRLGPRMWGPVSESHLQSLYRRGELTKVHQLSIDKLRWESAANLIASWNSPEIAETKPSKELVPPPDDWYYASATNEQLGPFTRKVMREKVIQNEIKPKSMIFGPGMTNWVPAQKVPFLGFTEPIAKKSIVPLALTLALGFFICVSTAAIGFLVIKSFGSQTQSEESKSEIAVLPSSTTTINTKKQSPPTKIGIVASVSDKGQIEEAVGRVQLIRKWSFSNGSVIELPDGHGTGFSVTSTGYILTNRHVVESYSPVQKQRSIPTNSGSQVSFIEGWSIILFIKKLRLEAQLVHSSNRYDLAILKVNSPRAMPYFCLSTSETPSPLDDVVAIGFPGVASRPTEFEAAGIAAKLDSEVLKALSEKCTVSVESQLPESSFGYSAVPGAVSKVSRDSKGPFVFHSAAIHGGNSGGPLVSKQNAIVLGINTLIQQDLIEKEVTNSQGGTDVITINNGNLNQAYLTNTFRNELQQHIPDALAWK
jgi:S1-C subfamily serine protease